MSVCLLYQSIFIFPPLVFVLVNALLFSFFVVFVVSCLLWKYVRFCFCCCYLFLYVVYICILC